jgi:hypothetical protein
MGVGVRVGEGVGEVEGVMIRFDRKFLTTRFSATFFL